MFGITTSDTMMSIFDGCLEAHGEGVQPVFGLDHLIALQAQEFPSRLPNGIFIFHQQERLRATAYAFSFRNFNVLGERRFNRTRKIDFEDAARSRLAVDPYETFILFDNSVNRGQTQPSTF